METIPTSTRTLGVAALVLTIIGALNWLLVGLFNFNLVSAIFGEFSPVSRILYVLVGISGLFLIYAARAFMPRVRPPAPTMTPRHPSAI